MKINKNQQKKKYLYAKTSHNEKISPNSTVELSLKEFTLNVLYVEWIIELFVQQTIYKIWIAATATITII